MPAYPSVRVWLSLLTLMLMLVNRVVFDIRVTVILLPSLLFSFLILN